MGGYDHKSCSALEKPFYWPIEAAIRWCGLIEHEAKILAMLGGNQIPQTGQFPSWPCLKANTEKILDAIEHGDIPHGRDGRTVTADDHVAPARRTVRHTDLREWMTKHYPDQKPVFLFDEIERKAHAAINADSFLALQVDRDALKTDLERARMRAILPKFPHCLNEEENSSNQHHQLISSIHSKKQHPGSHIDPFSRQNCPNLAM